MKSESRSYPAKLLLFGEHTVLLGYSSLAVPLPRYAMRWKDKISDHPSWLRPYLSYLKTQCADFLDVTALNEWIETKTIESNIPIGYGLGSSGALTAAIYDVCRKDYVETMNIQELQIKLGQMESFFHGKSSGLDPLVSFCGTPIIIINDEIRKVTQSKMGIGLRCYLLDSGRPRSGQSMIAQFLENSASEKEPMSKLGHANDNAIASMMESDGKNSVKILETISALQYELMPYMILPELRSYWREGLESKSYYIKICGAGGGGYYLVFSKKQLDNIGPYQLEEVILNELFVQF